MPGHRRICSFWPGFGTEFDIRRSFQSQTSPQWPNKPVNEASGTALQFFVLDATLMSAFRETGNGLSVPATRCSIGTIEQYIFLRQKCRKRSDYLYVWFRGRPKQRRIRQYQNLVAMGRAKLGHSRQPRHGTGWWQYRGLPWDRGSLQDRWAYLWYCEKRKHCRRKSNCLA